jgi:hypothetical protein
VDHPALQAADVNEHGISHKLFPVKDKKNRETINPPAALRPQGVIDDFCSSLNAALR